MSAHPRQCLLRLLLGAMICAACSSSPKQPDAPPPEEPALAVETTPAAAACAPPSPPLATTEIYVYAGLNAYSKPERRAADGTVTPVVRQAHDGVYEVITLQPDGRAQGQFFSARPGDTPRVSESGSACWRWKAAPERLELTIGEGRSEFTRRGSQLLRRSDPADALRTTRLYDRVPTPSAVAPSCTQQDDPLKLVPGAQRVAFAAASQDGLRAITLARDGRAEVIDIRTHAAELAWDLTQACWSVAEGKLRISQSTGSAEEYVVEAAGLRGASARYAKAQ